MFFKLFTILFYFVLSGGLQCSYAGGVTGGAMLKFYPSPRVNSMGESGVSLSGDYSASDLNPAILGTVEKRNFSALFYNSFLDSNVGYLGSSLKIGPGSLGIGVLGYFGGMITIDDSSGRHEGLHEQNFQTQKDIIYSSGYGFRIITGVYAGWRLKYYTSKLLESYRASSFSGDGGVLVKTHFFKTGHKNVYTRLFSPGIQVGGAVLNLGQGVAYTSGADTDPLPVLFKGGASYPVRFNDEHASLISLDITYEPECESVRGNVGLEYSHSEIIFFRAGYRLNYEIKNFTWGIGLKYNRFSLDYGMGIVGAINSEHSVMAAVEF